MLSSELKFQSPWIMGILNITPDSFSEPGRTQSTEAALQHAQILIEDGAAILDIGGEASGPGSLSIGSEAELRRIERVVAEVAPKIFVSVDTFRSKTAARCLGLGSRMINDISAMRADPEMRSVVKDFDAYIVLMHSKEDGFHPQVSESKKDYINLIQEIRNFLSARIDFAMSGGIPLEKIVIDPGMGRFLSHDPKYSWQLLRELENLPLEKFPVPLLIGTSRKSFLGGDLKNRDPISQLTAIIACNKSAQIIRTHNVKMAREFLDAWNLCHLF